MANTVIRSGAMLWAVVLQMTLAAGCARPHAAGGGNAASESGETDTDKATKRCAALGITPDAPLPAARIDPAAPTAWLSVSGSHIIAGQGLAFRGRGANLADTRGCGACACDAVSLADSAREVMRRMDALVDDWGANFIRLDLESYAQSATSIIDDAAYLTALQQIVAHVQTKPNVYLVLAVWFDPSLDDHGWPTDATDRILDKLVQSFGNVSQVLFGISNEPKRNDDGALDADVWERMNKAAETIRNAEALMGVPSHLILAQGTRRWARALDYYEAHPLTAGHGANIVYETHVYDHQDAFDALFVAPSKTLPVIIGEFGPTADQSMTLEDTAALMQRAEDANVPYLAWTFHGRCVPSLLVDTSGGGCGIGMQLKPSPWGQQLRERLGHPWP